MTIEGFTITNAIGSVDPSGERNRIPVFAAGIIVKNLNTEIRYNIIKENGTEGSDARGIYVHSQGADVKIHNNTISDNTYTASYYVSMESSQQIEPGGAGIYVESGSPEIYLNIISNNTSNANGGGISLGSEPVLNASRNGETTYPKIYKNTITNNTAQKGAGVYIYNNIDVQNADGNLWKRFNAPNATVDLVEHNSISDNDNRYTDNSLLSEDSSIRNGVQEGTDICFEPQITPIGALGVSPKDVDEEEPFIFQATYIFQGPDFPHTVETLEGTVTFQVPPALDLSEEASITINEESRTLKTEEFDADEGTVFITGITGNSPQVTLELYQTSELPAGEYPIKVIADADGTGTAYEPSGNFNDSGTASTTLTIKSLVIFTLEKVGSSQNYETFEAAFAEIGNGETATITTSESTEVIVTEEILIINGKDIRIKPADGETLTFKSDESDHGMFCVDGSLNGASLTLNNTVVQDATSTSMGAGFYVILGYLHLEDCKVIGNQSAADGAGIYMTGFSKAIIQKTLIDSNTSTVGNGGGLFVTGFSHATITSNTIIRNNSAKGAGGGVYLSDGELHLDNCWINDNESDNNGGGIYRNAGNVYTESGQWEFLPGSYYQYFSVNADGEMVNEFDDGRYPARVYFNHTIALDSDGENMVW